MERVRRSEVRWEEAIGTAAAACRVAVTAAGGIGCVWGGRVLTVETVRILRLVLGPVEQKARWASEWTGDCWRGWVWSESSSSDWYSVCPAHCGPEPSKARDLLWACRSGRLYEGSYQERMEWLAAGCHAQEEERGRESATGRRRAREGKAREEERVLCSWLRVWLVWVECDGWDAGSRRDSPGYLMAGWLGGLVDWWRRVDRRVGFGGGK